MHYVFVLMTIRNYNLSTKHLQSDWSIRVKYWPYGTLDFNIVLFDKKQQYLNAVAGKDRNALIKNKLMINYSWKIYFHAN